MTNADSKSTNVSQPTNLEDQPNGITAEDQSTVSLMPAGESMNGNRIPPIIRTAKSSGLKESLAALLKLISEKRKCPAKFGKTFRGSFNIARIIFEDGVEWIAKMPKIITKQTQERLKSEVATLMFLQNFENFPSPKLHDYRVNAINPTKTPFILMDKIPGISLQDALYSGMSREQMYNLLGELTSVRKTLMKHPFDEIGSLYSPPEEDTIVVGDMINLSNCELKFYRSNSWEDSAKYYYEQHTVSYRNGAYLDDDENRRGEQWLIHAYMATVLPSYVQRGQTEFYLAHTDLSVSNILVDPISYTLTVIIDWEFANTLPLQSVEHYPQFITNKKSFFEYFDDTTFEDPEKEFQLWRKYYEQQFDVEEYPEIVKLHQRIEGVILFEKLLRDPEIRTFELLTKAITTLQDADAFDPPIRSLPWEKEPFAAMSNSVVLQSEEETQTISTQTPALIDCEVQPTLPETEIEIIVDKTQSPHTQTGIDVATQCEDIQTVGDNTQSQGVQTTIDVATQCQDIDIIGGNTQSQGVQTTVDVVIQYEKMDIPKEKLWVRVKQLGRQVLGGCVHICSRSVKEKWNDRVVEKRRDVKRVFMQRFRRRREL